MRPLLGDDRRHAAKGRSDVGGIVLFALTAASALVWLSSAGHRFAWGSPTSVALVSASVVFAVALVAVERRAERPFLPFELLALPAVRYAVLTVVAFASAMFAMIFYLPVYLQLALNSNPAESGLLLLPLTGGIVVGAAITGRVIARSGRPRLLPTVSLSLAAASLLGLAWLPASRPLLIGLEITTGIGLGGVMSVMQIVTQSAAGSQRLGAAAATVSLARTFGSSIGAAAFGALIYGLIGGAPVIAAARTAVEDARIGRAFDIAFLAAAGLCLAAAWAASRVPTLRFDREQAVEAPAVD